jgi:ubiquinone/menaquinone biosynthesis C-methylase UbiE
VALGLALLALGAAPAGEDERILAALGLHAGMRVADVGAGDGRHVTLLAEAVGPAGHVFATEVDDKELSRIRSRVAEAGLANVTVLKGDQAGTGLGASCCDSVLLRLVYHHFENPEPMRRDLFRALKPGGRIAVIEVPPQAGWRRLPGVPDRGGHGIPASDLIQEMTSAGFRMAENHESWPAEAGAYCVVFERP